MLYIKYTYKIPTKIFEIINISLYDIFHSHDSTQVICIIVRKKVGTTNIICTTYIKNNNVITLFTHVLIALKIHRCLNSL